ncbi:MAG: response regulator transcription factor [Bernardetiaceae bacterium]|nr:response regulator transcription factor [Bernardetiaceae bacterium]
MDILIVDDELAQRTTLRTIIEESPCEVQIVGEAHSVESALLLHKKHKPDLILLDVELEDGTGFDFLEKVGDIDFVFTFITAHNDFAVKAFKYSALNYLLKPVLPEELLETIEKARHNKEKQNLEVRLQVLFEHLSDNIEKQKKIVLKDSQNIHIVKLEDILYLAADNNYTTFYLKNENPILISRTLKEYEKILEDKGFFRSHQSYLINIVEIAKISKKEGGYIVMSNQEQVPLATRRREQLLDFLKDL